MTTLLILIACHDLEAISQLENAAKCSDSLKNDHGTQNTVYWRLSLLSRSTMPKAPYCHSRRTKKKFNVSVELLRSKYRLYVRHNSIPNAPICASRLVSSGVNADAAGVIPNTAYTKTNLITPRRPCSSRNNPENAPSMVRTQHVLLRTQARMAVLRR